MEAYASKCFYKIFRLRTDRDALLLKICRKKNPRQNANNCDMSLCAFILEGEVWLFTRSPSLCPCKGIWIEGKPSALLLCFDAPFPCGFRFPCWASDLIGLSATRMSLQVKILLYLSENYLKLIYGFLHFYAYNKWHLYYIWHYHHW